MAMACSASASLVRVVWPPCGKPTVVPTTTLDPAAVVWINGHELKTEEKAKRGKREYAIPPKPSAYAPAVPPPIRLNARRNVVAVKVTPPSTSNDVLFDLRLDAIPRPAGGAGGAEEITEKLVTERAVVCDLCSAQSDSRPACVLACPHDAAFRIDGLTQLSELP